MAHVNNQVLWKGWAATLLPTFVLLLFMLLHRSLAGPTAAGLSFLAVIGLAYLFFPKVKIDFAKLLLGLGLALGVAVALAAWLGGI